MAAARNREIAPLLAMHGFPLSRSGGEMHWRIPGEESVSIRGNMWYSHYRGEGGDAISFVRRFFHMDFKEAVRFLLEQSAVPAAGPVQCERQEQKQLRLPPKDSSEEQVRRYLTGIRKVSADVAGYFIETGQVYQSRAEDVRQGKAQCNLVLVGMDRDGAPRQAHIKGMRQRAFRYDAPGSDKAYGFRHMGGSGPLYVFEAAIDLMSYVSLYPEDWRQGNYLALNGTAEAALFRTLEEYPEVRGVVLALDNDAGGIEGVMRLTGRLREKGYTDVSVQLPAWKDWNEELKARGGMDAVCAQPHPKLQMLEQVKDAVLARAVHAPRFVDGRYLERTFQAACSAQADELQNSCLQKLAAGALLRARHLLCTGGETTGLDRLADRAAELYQPHKDHITQDARLRSLGGQIQKMRAAEENMPARTAGQQAELADGWLHTAAAAMAADVSCMLKMSGRENTQAEEEEVRMGFC